MTRCWRRAINAVKGGGRGAQTFLPFAQARPRSCFCPSSLTAFAGGPEWNGSMVQVSVHQRQRLLIPTAGG